MTEECPVGTPGQEKGPWAGGSNSVMYAHDTTGLGSWTWGSRGSVPVLPGKLLSSKSAILWLSGITLSERAWDSGQAVWLVLVSFDSGTGRDSYPD